MHIQYMYSFIEWGPALGPSWGGPWKVSHPPGRVRLPSIVDDSHGISCEDHSAGALIDFSLSRKQLTEQRQTIAQRAPLEGQNREGGVDTRPGWRPAAR